MALRISDEENQKLNPGQTHSDRQFSGLNKAESKGSFDDTDKTTDASDSPENNLDKVKDAEENPVGDWKNSFSGGEKNSTKISGWFDPLKKKGPLVGIILTLVGGGIGIGGLLSPSLLLIQLKETFSSFLDNASPALSIRTNKMLFKKFSGVKNAFTQSTNGNCNIRCKFGSINETMKRNLEAKGWKPKFEEKTFMGVKRYALTEITVPGETTPIKTGKEFNEAMKKPSNASKFKKVFNNKTAYFLNSKFGSVIKTKFGIDKLSKLTSKLKEDINGKLMTAKESVKASIREKLGLPPVEIGAPKLSAMDRLRQNPKAAPIFEFLDNKAGAAVNAVSKASNVIGAVCLTYNTSKGIIFATKAAKMAVFVGFAMMFLSAPDQMKAGDADGEVISALGDQLTQVDADGKSATDSLGYRIAAYGDTSSATDDETKYSASPSNPALGFIATLMGVVSLGGVIAITALKSLCKAGGNIVVSAATTCPEQIATALATGLETAGIGAAVAAAWCIGKMIAISAAAGTAIGIAISKITGLIANGDVPDLDENTIGAAAGNSIYTGSAQLLGGMASGYGLGAGNSQQIEQYAIDTASIQRQNAAIAAYEAQDTPFDIYNQYSFLGSIAQKINLGSFYGSSLISSIGNFLSIVPRSFANITNNVGAEAAKKSAVYGKCTDPGLVSIGVDADAFCNPSYVMSSSELNADIDEVIDYMVANNYIDEETGEVIDDPNYKVPDLLGGGMVHIKNNYKKYLDNCANRTDPLGDTGAPIESNDYEWEVGLKCTGKDASASDLEMLKNFRAYTMDKAINDTMDEDLSTVGSINSTIDTTPTTDTTNLYADSTYIECATGTTDAGIGQGYSKGKIVNIHLCSLPNTKDMNDVGYNPVKVNARVSEAFFKLMEGLKTSIGTDKVMVHDGFRTMAQQERFWCNYTFPIGKNNGEMESDYNCGSIERGNGNMAAYPGTSNHQMGLAVDFELATSSNGVASKPRDEDYIYDWLTDHASSYGILKLPDEAWHWQLTGAN